MNSYRQRWNKYGNVSCRYGDYTYASKKEAYQAQELDLLKKAGKIIEWHRQVPIKIEINGGYWRTWVVDFMVEHLDGSKEYIEVKGFETRDYKQKRDAAVLTFFKNNPDCRLTVIK